MDGCVMSECLYLNGDYMPLEQGRVPVEDRGYLFGDGIYEVVRRYAGRFFRLPEHLARLRASAAAIELAVPWPDDELSRICETLASRSGLADCTVYFQITRGVAPRAHLFPKGTRPSIMAFARAVAPPSPAQREAGVPVIGVTDDRWGRCHIKSLNLLANVLAKEKAHEAGGYEGLFVRDGIVTEGTVSNAFLVKGRAVFTHPANHRILHGVTRAAVIEVAKASGFPVREEPRTLGDFLDADEGFLSGTTVEVLGVATIDGKPLRSGGAGPVTKTLHDAFVKLTRGGAVA
jgi:D-alanine transaminase